MPKQYGAIPFRLRKNKVEVMLVTSRDGKRWVVPKGWPMKQGPRYTARREAFEESGVKGKVRRKPLGSYQYRKKIDRRSHKIDLHLYPLAVRKQTRNFPEKRQRRTRWFTLREAIKRCGDPALGRLLRKVKKAVR